MGAQGGCGHHQSAPGLAAAVEGRQLRIGALGSISRGRPVNQHGVDLLQCVVADTKAFGHSLAEVLNENVRLLHQLADDFHAFVRLEVEGYATLVPVVCLEVGIAVRGKIGIQRAGPPQAAAAIAVQRLDLDYVGAHVAHHGGGHGAELPDRPVQNPDALQRSAGSVSDVCTHAAPPGVSAPGAGCPETLTLSRRTTGPWPDCSTPSPRAAANLWRPPSWERHFQGSTAAPKRDCLEP